jgi:hypothetical protein
LFCSILPPSYSHDGALDADTRSLAIMKRAMRIGESRSFKFPGLAGGAPVQEWVTLMLSSAHPQ